MSQTILSVRIRRQDGPRAAPRWERFRVPRLASMTVADILHAIDTDPRLEDGQPTTPIGWASGCTWPTCGVCTMSINGRAAPACGTSIDTLPVNKPLRLAPLDAFPLLRDLWVDRSRMREDIARVGAYCEAAGPDDGDASAALFSRCTRCGACLDACPETHTKSPFVGPYALGAVHATQLAHGAPLPLSLLGTGGIADCGHVQNCVEVCPEAIPLDVAISRASREAPRRWLASLLGRKEKK